MTCYARERQQHGGDHSVPGGRYDGAVLPLTLVRQQRGIGDVAAGGSHERDEVLQVIGPRGSGGGGGGGG